MLEHCGNYVTQCGNYRILLHATVFDGEINRDRHRSHSVALQYFSTLVKISQATI